MRQSPHRVFHGKVQECLESRLTSKQDGIFINIELQMRIRGLIVHASTDGLPIAGTPGEQGRFANLDDLGIEIAAGLERDTLSFGLRSGVNGQDRMRRRRKRSAGSGQRPGSQVENMIKNTESVSIVTRSCISTSISTSNLIYLKWFSLFLPIW